MIVINTGFAATAHLLAETKQQQADTEDDYDNDESKKDNDKENDDGVDAVLPSVTTGEKNWLLH